MNRILYFLFFSLLSTQLFSQLQPSDQLRNDSLLIILKQGKTDSIQARAAFHLSKLWINLDSVRGLEYLQQGKNLAKNNAYLNAIYRYQSIPSYSDEQEVNAMLELFRRYDNADSWDYTYRVAINRVRWLNNKARSDEATSMLKKDVIPLVDKLKNPAYLAEVPLEMGRAFLNQGKDREAIPYLEKSAASYENIQPKDGTVLYNQIHVLGSLANIYNTLKENQKADSVISRAKELLLIQPNRAQELRIVSNEAMFLTHTKQYKAADKLIEKTLAKSKDVPRRYLLQLYFQRHKVLAGMGKHQQALEVLQKSHPIDSIRLEKSTFNALDLSKLLPAYALAHEQVNDYKQATHYWKQYFTHRDSVGKDEIAEEVSKLEVQLRTQEKEAAISLLTAEKNETTLLLEKQHVWNGLFIAVVALLLTLLGFILYIFKNKQKVHTHRMNQWQTDHELAVTKALLEGEERERQRIGRDLHDSLGGALVGVRMQLSESQQQTPEPCLDRAILQLEDSISEVRRIARNMVPESLLYSGLDTALQDLSVAFSTKEINIEYQSSELSTSLPNSIQTNLYRIVQELLVNAVRHGSAKNIIVQCLQNEETILLTVEDDGLGFDVQGGQQSAGIGLKNIQRRVDYMQGQFHIESQPDQGTTINIEIHVS